MSDDARPLVVALGDPCRADDGAGAAVARALAALERPDLDVAGPVGPADLIDLWQGRDAVVVVDAVRSGAPPGTVHTVVVTAPDGTPSLGRRGTAGGTHGLGLADVVALARALGRLPDRLVVVGVEAASFEPGAPLSPAVADAVPAAGQVVLALLGALRP